jgi:hypothetical protein
MFPQDLYTIIGEYLELNTIIILSELLNTNEWNVYELGNKEYVNKYNFNFVNLNYIPEDLNSIYMLDLRDINMINNITKNNIKNLRKLNLGYNYIQDSVVKNFPNGLYELNLWNITGHVIKYFPKGLHTLDLSCSMISDPCIKNLPRYLRVLNLNNTYITDFCIKDLPKRLHTFYVKHTGITKQGCKYILDNGISKNVWY